MYEGFARDIDGSTYFPADVAALLAASASAPMYGHFDSLLGRGVVGGALMETSEQGRIAGELAADVLARRVSPDAPPRAGARPTCAVDVRQLERWDIPADRVPDGCVQAFRESGLLANYPWQVSAALGLIILQAVLLGLLLYLWRQKRHSALETQRMRVELAHAARLAAVGELTAAISHEINQPLGAVQSSADAAEMLLESPSPRLDRVREILANIRAANHRASEVVRRLRTLLHKHEPTRQTFDLNEIVDDVLRMVDAELRRRRIGIESSSAQRPLWLEGDAGADPAGRAQPAPERDGRDRQRAGRAAPHPRARRERRRRHGGAAGVRPRAGHRRGGPAAPVRIVLHDQAARDGARLSVSHSIVKAHGGRIHARNNSHGGATFAVALAARRPARRSAHRRMTRFLIARRTAMTTMLDHEHDETATPSARARPIIHFVDDDAMFRSALAEVLELAGYDVKQYESAGAFLLSGPPQGPGCILLDLRMPGPTGSSCRKRSRATPAGCRSCS
jgi:signal transduction histidine kinase